MEIWKKKEKKKESELSSRKDNHVTGIASANWLRQEVETLRYTSTDCSSHRCVKDTLYPTRNILPTLWIDNSFEKCPSELINQSNQSIKSIESIQRLVTNVPTVWFKSIKSQTSVTQVPMIRLKSIKFNISIKVSRLTVGSIRFCQ